MKHTHFYIKMTKNVIPPKNDKKSLVIEVIRASMLEGGSFLGFLRGFCVGEG